MINMCPLNYVFSNHIPILLSEPNILSHWVLDFLSETIRNSKKSHVLSPMIGYECPDVNFYTLHELSYILHFEIVQHSHLVVFTD